MTQPEKLSKLTATLLARGYTRGECAECETLYDSLSNKSVELPKGTVCFTTDGFQEAIFFNPKDQQVYIPGKSGGLAHSAGISYHFFDEMSVDTFLKNVDHHCVQEPSKRTFWSNLLQTLRQ